MGFLELQLGGGAKILIYSKPNHTPATSPSSTFLLMMSRPPSMTSMHGVTTKIYADDQLPSDSLGHRAGQRT
jgi:hypothetical protein